MVLQRYDVRKLNTADVPNRESILPFADGIYCVAHCFYPFFSSWSLQLKIIIELLRICTFDESFDFLVNTIDIITHGIVLLNLYLEALNQDQINTHVPIQFKINQIDEIEFHLRKFLCSNFWYRCHNHREVFEMVDRSKTQNLNVKH